MFQLVSYGGSLVRYGVSQESISSGVCSLVRCTDVLEKLMYGAPFIVVIAHWVHTLKTFFRRLHYGAHESRIEAVICCTDCNAHTCRVQSHRQVWDLGLYKLPRAHGLYCSSIAELDTPHRTLEWHKRYCNFA